MSATGFSWGLSTSTRTEQWCKSIISNVKRKKNGTANILVILSTVDMCWLKTETNTSELQETGQIETFRLLSNRHSYLSGSLFFILSSSFGLVRLLFKTKPSNCFSIFFQVAIEVESVLLWLLLPLYLFKHVY